MNRQADIAAAMEQLANAEKTLMAALPPEARPLFLDYEAAFLGLYNAANCLCLHDESERRAVRAAARAGARVSHA